MFKNPQIGQTLAHPFLGQCNIKGLERCPISSGADTCHEEFLSSELRIMTSDKHKMRLVSPLTLTKPLIGCYRYLKYPPICLLAVWAYQGWLIPFPRRSCFVPQPAGQDSPDIESAGIYRGNRLAAAPSVAALVSRPILWHNVA